LRLVEVSRAGVVSILDPVVAMILAFVVLGEGLEVLQIAGAALVILASVLVQTSPRAEPSPISDGTSLPGPASST
jgi:drug/metabolite transporter (DMT)-like permease